MNYGYTKQIRERILSAEDGSVFTASDFADIADTTTVRQSLKRIAESGTVRRILNGIYEKPKYSALLEEYVAADPDAVAKALARSYHWTIAPCGNTALNLLGVSTQVTAVWSYISDGPYRTYEWNSTKLEFKHRTNKEITGLSYMTSLLIQALNDAVDLGYLEKNPALKTKPIKTCRSEIRILTRDEALRLMTVAKEYDMVAWIVVVIALGTGMRLAEIFGLSWNCIDFRSAKLYVEQSAVKTNHGTVIQNEVKTKNSRREVPLPKFVVQALIEYKRWQEFYKVKNTGLFVDKGYVIANQYGNVRHPASFSYHVFKKALLPRAGISEKVRFHDLRHTHATWLLASGVNVKVVSERLGHSTIRITLDTYAHVIKTMQTAAVEKLDNIYLGEDPMKQIE